jgi:tetratricopeptide (TPR) repeat protein
VPKISTEMPPTPAAVAGELERIAASRSFCKAEQCLRLLRHITQCALDGRGSELKEYTLGVTVFERPDSFDPRVDAVVRLEARRLRLKLAEYYQQEGHDDPVVIELPKGAYVPYFRLLTQPQAEPVEPAPAKPPFRPWALVVVAALCLSLGASFLLPKRERATPVRTSIAVLGFHDESAAPETSWIDTAVSELMNIEFGAGQQFRTLPAENIARMRRELAIVPQTGYSAPVLQRIGTNLGSDYAVAGSYQVHGERIRLDVALFDLRSGRQIAAMGDDSSADQLSGLARSTARRIRAQLGIRLSSGSDVAAAPPVEPAAMESYARGMERLRQSDALDARPYLERAAALVPSNPLVHSGLAAAWSMLGLDSRAREESKLAFDSSNALGRVQQLEVEGRYREMAHDWPRAIQVYQALVTLLPDDLEYGLLLASVETKGGKAQDALAFISALRRLPRPMGDDPRIDLAEAQSAGALADFAHTRKSAHAAAEKARAHGARLQYARARLLESGAMQNLDIPGYADVRAEARGICAELGDRACVAAAFRIEANALAVSGGPAKARPLYAAVLEIANEMGNQLEKLNAYAGLGYTEELQGDLKAAEADYGQALAAATEIGPQKRYPACLDLAQVLAEEGRIADSRALSSEALEGSRQSHDREGAGMAQAALAHTLALEGKFPEAAAAYNQAIGVLREVQEPFQLAVALLGFGDAQLEQGDLAAARKTYQEAGDLNRQHKDFLRPEVDVASARLALASGQAEEAANRARAAMVVYEAAGREGDRLQAAALLARALVAHGDTAGASGALAGIPAPDGRAFPIEAAVQFRIARCLVAARSGRRAEADREMDSIAAEVSRLGLAPLEKQTRLARETVMKTVSAGVNR